MEKIDIPSTVSIFGCVSQVCFSTGHVAIGVLKGNGRNNILQCRDTECKDSVLGQRGEKKLLKFIGWKKESTTEYITQHQLFQGQERSDCSSGTQSNSQWDWWDYIVQEKSGIKAAERQAPNACTQSVMASLHHCPHTYVSLDSMCGLVAAAQESPSTAATDPFLFSNLSAMQRLNARLHMAPLTFDREDSKITHPAGRELVSNLICPWGWDWCRPGLKEVQNRHVLSAGCVAAGLQITKVV